VCVANEYEIGRDADAADFAQCFSVTGSTGSVQFSSVQLSLHGANEPYYTHLLHRYMHNELVTVSFHNHGHLHGTVAFFGPVF